jgi:hypothetical protein
MFPINQHLASILFYSRSSCSFVSQAFAQKYNKPVTKLGYGNRIISIGAIVLTNWMFNGATLDIQDWRFWVNLVVMTGLVLDVLVGMN